MGGVEELLYAFERFNPRRVMRWQESVKLVMLELELSGSVEAEAESRVSLEIG